MPVFEDLTGKRFGHLTAIEYTTNHRWRWRCDCGNEVIIRPWDVKNGLRDACSIECKYSEIQSKLSDITGKKYGKLLVIKRVGHDERYQSLWLCRCDCGNEVVTTKARLNASQKTDCGCVAKEKLRQRSTTHGGTPAGSWDRLYTVYMSMKHRCYYEKEKDYKNYGGRGVTICDEWLGRDGYARFRDWAYENGYDENAPFGECTIDRIDVNGNYEPSNCRWVTARQQAQNRTNTLKVSAFGKTQTIYQWSLEYGIPTKRIYSRIYKQDWNPERAITEPVDTRKWTKAVRASKGSDNNV